MNEINAAQRKRVAAQDYSWDKIKIVTKVEAEAERSSSRLVAAEQRKVGLLMVWQILLKS